MIQTAARIALAVMILSTMALAIWCHGKERKAFTVNCIPMLGIGLLEVTLIWLAGGWGG